MVLIYAVGESVTHVLVSSMAKAELVKIAILALFSSVTRKVASYPGLGHL